MICVNKVGLSFYVDDLDVIHIKMTLEAIRDNVSSK